MDTLVSHMAGGLGFGQNTVGFGHVSRHEEKKRQPERGELHSYDERGVETRRTEENRCRLSAKKGTFLGIVPTAVQSLSRK